MATRQYRQVTVALVTLVKKYLEDPNYSALTLQELAKVTDSSATTVARIRDGEYDNLLTPKVDPTVNTEPTQVTTAIPYEEFTRLLECKRALQSMINTALLSDKEDNMLYFPRNATFQLVKQAMPEEVAAKLKELQY